MQIRLYRNAPGGAPAPTIYDYGYPTGATVEPNVVAQWIFNEASGDILDQVNSVDLTPTQVGVGQLSYSVPIGYSDQTLEDVSPGVCLMNRTGNNYTLRSADTSLAMGTGSWTVEWIASYVTQNNLQNTATILDTQNNSYEQGVYLYYDNASHPTTCRFEIYLRDAAASGFYLAGNIAVNPFLDMKIHKHRVVLDRAGNAEYFIDGVSMLSGSMAAAAGKDFPCTKFQIGGVTTGQINSIFATFYEFRISANATNNSSGPGGG